MHGLWLDFSAKSLGPEPPYDWPGDRVIQHVQSDSEAVIRQLLTVNHLPADGTLMEGGELYHFTGFPEVAGKYASTMWTDVIGVRLF